MTWSNEFNIIFSTLSATLQYYVYASFSFLCPYILVLQPASEQLAYSKPVYLRKAFKLYKMCL